MIELPAWTDEIRQDTRYAARRLVRAPWVSLATVAILSVGLTASVAIFAYISSFDRVPPGVDRQGLYRVSRVTDDDPFRALSYPDFQDLRRGGSAFTGVAAVSGRFAASVRHPTTTDVAFAQAVTGDFFSLLGVAAAAGRLLGPEDDSPGAARTVMLSHRYWMARYSGDRGAVGQTVIVNGEPFTIVGVVHEDFLGPIADVRPDIWLPFEQYKRVYWARSSIETDSNAAVAIVYGRVAQSKGAAGDALRAMAGSLDAARPLEVGERHFSLSPSTWMDPAARRSELPTAKLWLAAGLGLLLLACANVSNLVLAASARRDSEMAVRRALGARVGRLVRQLLAENVILAGSAGLVALALAGPVSRRVGAYFARPSVWGANVAREVDFDPRVLFFVVGISIAAGVLAGVVPALRASRRDAAAALRRTASDRRSGARLGSDDLMIASQIGLSLVLLTVAGLVLRALLVAGAVDAGFDTSRTVASYVSTSSLGIEISERHAFYEELERRFDELPWVVDATIADYAPLSDHSRTDVRTDDMVDPLTVSYSRVAEGYFETLDIALLEGRPFAPSDSLGGEPVVVLGAGLAQRLFGTDSGVGRVVSLDDFVDGEDVRVRVIGVAGDARLENLLGPPEMVVYLPFAQHYSAPGNALLVATTEPPAVAARMVEEELRRVDPGLAVVNVLPYADVIDGFLYEQRMNAELFVAVAILGAFLAAVGVFAILSVMVGQRRRELGVRVALGATGGRIGRLVARRIVVAGLLGVAAGVVLTIPVSRWVASVLSGVEPWDPLSLAVAAFTLLVAAGAAAAPPVLRAVRLDPAESLRL
jgi:predicted permease